MLRNRIDEFSDYLKNEGLTYAQVLDALRAEKKKRKAQQGRCCALGRSKNAAYCC